MPFSETSFFSIPLHSSIEAIGSLAAIVFALALLLLFKDKSKPYYLSAACGLIAMGLFDTFHSFSPLNNNFVWLHTIATLFGGVFFALVWHKTLLSKVYSQCPLPIIVGTFAVTVGFASLLFPEAVPLMLEGGKFTLLSRLLNISGGLLFLSAALFFYLEYRSKKSIEKLFFIYHCALFGVAGVIFEFSELWDVQWWIWHLLRLSAYLMGMVFFLQLFQKAHLQLKEETLLRRKEQDLTNAILDAQVDTCFVFDPENGKAIRWNKSFEKVSGYTNEEISNLKAPESYYGSEDLQKAAKAIEELSRTGQTMVELLLVGKDGAKVPTEYIVTEIKGANDHPYFVSIGRDITDRLSAENQLRESESRLQMAIDGTNDGLWIWDIETDFEWHAPRWKELLGYEQNEPLPEKYDTWESRIHPDDRKATLEVLRLHLEENKPYDCEHRLRKKDGSYFWIHDRGLAIRNDEGKPIRMGGAIQDITERKNLENELKKKNKDLKITLEELKDNQEQLILAEKMASLGNLVAGLAHEINTPVGIAVTATSHLEQISKDTKALFEQNTLKKSELEKYLDQVAHGNRLALKNLQRTAELIRSFKLVAVDQTSDEKRGFELRQYLNEILLSLAPQYKNRKIEIEIIAKQEIPLHSFPGSFAQIVTNLVMNSLFHAFDSGESGEICITLAQEQENIIIIYSDNGKGIPEKDLPKVFDPFFTTKRGEGGTGLGLQIVFNLVHQALGGEITCESVLGEGTTFSMKIPLNK